MAKPERESKAVCSACLTEACAAGILMCEDARRAGITITRDAGQERRSVAVIARRIDQIIGWAKTGERRDHYVMEREHVDRMRDDIITYAFGEKAGPPAARPAPAAAALAGLRETITAERERRSKAADGTPNYERQNRYWGWTDALDWVLALFDPEAERLGPEGRKDCEPR